MNFGSSGSSCKRRVGSVPGLKRKSQNRPSVAIASSLISESRQRVMSARQHRQKSLQNQLSELLQQNAVNLHPFSNIFYFLWIFIINFAVKIGVIALGIDE